MEPNPSAQNADAALREVLGFLNFSEGKPDPRFERNVNELWRPATSDAPWRELAGRLGDALATVRGTSAAFRDVAQAEAVIAIVFDRLLPAYRAHHEDLLAHRSDEELFQPYFVVRAFETVLAAGGPWDETDRIVHDALARLNDFIGHRPLPVLETHKCEPYDHERVRPIPLYIHGAGVAVGPFHDVVAGAIDLLAKADPALCREAHFDLELLDELALDPRAYDFSDPVNQRPNYLFGEWDPHLLDNQSRYRRFVVRSVAMEALTARIEEERRKSHAPDRRAASPQWVTDAQRTEPDASEILFEAAAVLAGTMLMASMTSGSGPDTYDSSITLDALVPRIARLRDAFYAGLIESVGGPHGERLRREAEVTRQPFGGARQHLNRFIATRRAAQLEHAELARLFARMGQLEASRDEAAVIPTASTRLGCEIEGSITAAHLALDRAETAEAVRLLEQAETFLHRAIASGAIVDPWNLLGFQGQFSLWPAIENSMPDPRVEQLTEMMDALFTLHARLLAEAAAAGERDLEKRLTDRLTQLAAWWDQFATTEIADIEPVRGQESLDSATHVARALAAWRAGGESAGDIRFWRQHSEGFHSPRAYAQVVQALLAKRDHVAAMALLMQWLSRAAEVPLEQGSHSFHSLALRWLAGQREGVIGQKSEVRGWRPAGGKRKPKKANATESPVSADSWPLVRRFFDYLEANAEDYWQVPALELGLNVADDANDSGVEPDGDLEATIDDENDDSSDDVFAAAYENVSFHDSARDGVEGDMLEGGPQRREFELEFAAERIEPRLKFLATLAKLWQQGAGIANREPGASDRGESLRDWSEQAERNRRDLARLLERVHEHAVPPPLGSPDSLVEFDRHRAIKENLIYSIIATEVETTATTRRLLACLDRMPPELELPAWQARAVELDRTLARGDAAALREKLAAFLDEVAGQPMLYRPLAKGGHPRDIVAVRCIQQLFRELVQSLPRAGLVRETFAVLRTARSMEQRHPVGGAGITEFDHLFRSGFAATVESVLAASRAWPANQRADEPLLECLESLTEPFLKLWLDHSQSLRLSTLERISTEAEWQELRQFIETYGHDLFTPRFLLPQNIRAVLEQGIERFFAYQEENADPLHPLKLIEDLDRGVRRGDAQRLLELALTVFLENFETYTDYNTTTTQSDYGERFFVLFEFLRLKAWYDRAAWNLEPVALAHEAIARAGRDSAAHEWQRAVAEKTTGIADDLAARLGELERQYGARLATVSDRLKERFVKPLELARLRIAIEPAMREACGRGATENTTSDNDSAFSQLRRLIADYAETTTGVGIDVPHWLRVLDAEVRRVRATLDGDADPTEPTAATPTAPLSFEELKRQLELWDQPL